ncbi:hypothetical protein GGF31_004409 [Allomyces arbusculus]|nr:hypothetical protein GGF31_004409 [Allomyces arbusculus]
MFNSATKLREAYKTPQGWSVTRETVVDALEKHVSEAVSRLGHAALLPGPDHHDLTITSTPIPRPPGIEWHPPRFDGVELSVDQIANWWRAVLQRADTPELMPVHVDPEPTQPGTLYGDSDRAWMHPVYLTCKTTHRTVYADAQSRAQAAFPHDVVTDVLLTSADGRIAESCIANIALFCFRTLTWITPATSGPVAFLAGCKRRDLLEDGWIVEAETVALANCLARPAGLNEEVPWPPAVAFNSVRGCYPIAIVDSRKRVEKVDG